jgi:TetR/AcrR family transcriptional regulator, transcriptional repressor for nem operon
MAGKAELTTQYILETVAPVFNRYGYAGTSMSEITKATKLTKGAIYGNFENKEKLAVEAFNYHIRKVIGLVSEKMDVETSPVKKLKALTNFYRNYYHLTKKYGGCPILNVGVDSKHQNPALLKRVREVMVKLQEHIANIIKDGMTQKQFKKDIKPDVLALRILSQIEGGIFITNLMDSEDHMKDVMDQIDKMIESEMVL